MLFTGHWATTLLAGRRLGGGELELRAAAALVLCALLPDLVDKPLFWLGLAPVPTTRLWGHTLLFNLGWCLVCRRWIPALWPWALAAPGHLLLDMMWLEPQTLFWPALGWRFAVVLPPELNRMDFLACYAWMWQHHPGRVMVTVAGELVGLVLAWREVGRLRLQFRKSSYLLPGWPVIETQQSPPHESRR